MTPSRPPSRPACAPTWCARAAASRASRWPGPSTCLQPTPATPSRASRARRPARSSACLVAALQHGRRAGRPARGDRPRRRPAAAPRRGRAGPPARSWGARWRCSRRTGCTRAATSRTSSPARSASSACGRSPTCAIPDRRPGRRGAAAGHGRSRLVVTVSDLSRSPAGPPALGPARVRRRPRRCPVARAVRASAAIPFFFRPVGSARRPGRRRWVDGGAAGRLPGRSCSTAPTALDPRWPTFGVRLTRAARHPADHPPGRRPAGDRARRARHAAHRRRAAPTSRTPCTVEPDGLRADRRACRSSTSTCRPGPRRRCGAAGAAPPRGSCRAGTSTAT